MTPDEQKYYETQLDMFVSDGWKHFISQVVEMSEATNSIVNLAPEDLRFKQGELSIMSWIIGWPDQVRRTYEDLDNEDKEKADAEASARAA